MDDGTRLYRLTGYAYVSTFHFHAGVSPYLVALTSFLTKIPDNPRLRLLGYDHEAYYLIKPERDRAHQRATELLNP
jgi:hypothetical protein